MSSHKSPKIQSLQFLLQIEKEELRAQNAWLALAHAQITEEFPAHIMWRNTLEESPAEIASTVQFCTRMLISDDFARASHSHNNPRIILLLNLDNYRTPPEAPVGHHACRSSCTELSTRSFEMTTQLVYLIQFFKLL